MTAEEALLHRAGEPGRAGELRHRLATRHTPSWFAGVTGPEAAATGHTAPELPRAASRPANTVTVTAP